MDKIFIAVAIIGSIGLLAGALLVIISAICNKSEENQRLTDIRDSLPGANCGACGYAGCDAYAEAIDNGEAEPNLCAPGGATSAQKLSEVLGVEITATPMVARVLCNGCSSNTDVKYKHQGLASCRAATLLSGGPQECSYGCIGFGDCVAACEFNAISVTDGLAEVNPQLCGGCGACAKACPKGIIEIMPKTKSALVLCSNHDKGATARKICKASCIGCTACLKVCEQSAIHMDNFLAVIDPQKCTGCGACALKCPQKAIVIMQ